MGLIVFYTSVSANRETKKLQEKIFSVLESKKIEFERVDIAQCSEDKEKMRELVKNPAALPPQIVNGDVHCGDGAEFEKAIEDEELEKFLKI